VETKDKFETHKGYTVDNLNGEPIRRHHGYGPEFILELRSLIDERMKKHERSIESLLRLCYQHPKISFPREYALLYAKLGKDKHNIRQTLLFKYHPYLKEEKRKIRSRYYKENKDKILNHNAEYYANNREARKAHQREYYQKNKEIIKAKRKVSREEEERALIGSG